MKMIEFLNNYKLRQNFDVSLYLFTYINSAVSADILI